MIGGWKTIVGALHLAFSMTLPQAQELLAPELYMWLMVGSSFTGAFLTPLGIAHKIEKGFNKLSGDVPGAGVTMGSGALSGMANSMGRAGVVAMAFLLAVSVAGLVAMGCSKAFLNAPSICDEGSPKVAQLKAYMMTHYGVEVQSDESVLCDIANAHEKHLEGTADLIFFIDVGAIRLKVHTKQQAIRVYRDLKRYALSGVEITSGDMASFAMKYAARYPGLGIVLQYTNLLNMPDYRGMLFKDLDLAKVVWWCDRNEKLLQPG